MIKKLQLDLVYKAKNQVISQYDLWPININFDNKLIKLFFKALSYPFYPKIIEKKDQLKDCKRR